MIKLNLNENFISRIWEESSYYSDLKTTEGEKVVVVNYGKKNNDAGPDYKDAKVKIGNVVYSGSIEIHRSLKEWHEHNHKRDNKYNELILQVVLYSSEDDFPKVKKSRSVPTVVLSEFLTKSIHAIWKEIINNPSLSFKLPCYSQNKKVAFEIKVEWLNKLSIERLKYKTQRISLRLEEISEDDSKKIFWEQVLFEFICEALGYSKNKEQFLKLARRIKLNKIKEMKLDKIQIESLLFGLGGFLKDLRFKDFYLDELKLNWNYLKDILRKEIMDKSEWNFFRLRPPNFPTLRIAYASGLLYEILYNDFFKKIIKIFEESKNLKSDLESCFITDDISDYWKNHYNFGKESLFRKASKSENKIVGRERITDIISNVILPVVYFYSIKFENESLRKRVEFYYKKEKQKSGTNEITRVMEKQLDVKVHSLSDEQGLIQLHNFYCIQGRCSECEIGKIVFAREETLEPLKIILY